MPRHTSVASSAFIGAAELQYNVRDYVRDGLLRVFHIGTNLNAADFFTKPLTGEKFSKFRDFLMGGYIRKDDTLLHTFAVNPRLRPRQNSAVVRR